MAGLLLAQRRQALRHDQVRPRGRDERHRARSTALNPDGTGFTVIAPLRAVHVDATRTRRRSTPTVPFRRLNSSKAAMTVISMARRGRAARTAPARCSRCCATAPASQVLHQFDAITSTTASGLTVTDGRGFPGRAVGAGGRRLLLRHDVRRAGPTVAARSSGLRPTVRASRCCTRSAPPRQMRPSGLLENADGAMPLAGLTDGGDGFLYGVDQRGRHRRGRRRVRDVA